MSKIAPIFTQLLHQATVTGCDQHATLSKGAHTQPRALGNEITLTIARPKQQIGAGELIVFRKDCGVPPEAQRWPQEGQRTLLRDGAPWQIVAFRWYVAEAEAAPLAEEAVL